MTRLSTEREMTKKLALVFILSLGFSFAASADMPTETIVHVENAYAPAGFDSNDNTEIIIEGYLPNVCHKSPITVSRVNGNEIDISVKALKYSTSNPFCPQMIVPFLKPVSIGVLKEGQYNIVVNRGTQYETHSQIEIAPAAKETVDDFLYAHVEFIQTIPGTNKVALHGYQPSNCLKFDEVLFISNKVDTYSILPKMKQVSQICTFKRTPFYAEWVVPSEIQREKILLHVRKMDGQSFNMIYY